MKDFSEIVSIHQEITGSPPSKERIEFMLHLKEVLNIKNNDALWIVILVNEVYQFGFEKILAKIAEVTKASVGHAHLASEINVRQILTTLEVSLTSNASQILNKVAAPLTHKQRLQWIMGSILGSSLAFTSFGLVCFAMGKNAGYQAGNLEGYRAAQDEKATAAWANTSEGKAAYQLAKAGSIRLLANCSQPGWHKAYKNSVLYCFPETHKGKIYGWRLPQ